MLSQDDQVRITEAIRDAERHTGGEIVVVVARASADYWPWRLAAAGLVALLTPLPLILFTQLSAERIYLAQLAAFVAGVGLMSLRAVWSKLVPRATQRAFADEAAFAQFHLRDVAETTSRAGVLIYCSEAERHARIVADVAVARQVSDDRWAGAVAALCEDAAQGRLAEGCVAAVRICGEVLAEAIPRTADDVNERPDAVYTI